MAVGVLGGAAPQGVPTSTSFLVADPLGPGVDDTTNFIAALDAASAEGRGEVILARGGDYLANEIPFPRLPIPINLNGGRIRKIGGSGSTAIFRGQGTEGASTLLTANGVFAAASVAVTNAAGVAGLVAGAHVLIRDGTYKYATTGRNQELNRVLSVVGNVVNLTRPLLAAYATASAATLVVISPARPILYNGYLEIPDGTFGGLVFLDLTYGFESDGVHYRGPNELGCVEITRSTRFRVHGGSMRDGQNPGVAGSGYGMIVGESSHGGVIEGLHTENVRENAVSNNVRDVDWLGVTADGNYDSAINSHGSGNERIRMIGCKGRNLRGAGFLAGYSGALAPDLDITMEDCEVDGAGTIAFASDSPAGQRARGIKMRRCRAKRWGTNGIGAYAFFLVNGDVVRLENLAADGMDIAVSGSGISLTGLNDAKLLGAELRRMNTHYGVTFSASTDIEIAGVDGRGLGSYAVRSLGGNTRATVHGCDTDRAAGGAYLMVAGERWFDNRRDVEHSDKGDFLITYAASMTPDCFRGGTFRIIATNGTAFTINAPTSPVIGAVKTFIIKNSSGGALGVATWNVVFKMAAWVQPANGFQRSITFRYDGVNWIESYRSAVDIAA